MTIALTRADLARAFPNDTKLQRAFEALFQTSASTADTVSTNTEATSGLVNAAFVTLSANDALPNERILSVGEGLTISDDGARAVLALASVIATQGGYRLTFNLRADTSLTLPPDGELATTTISDDAYASDSTAATGGVAVGEAYRRTDGVVAWRAA